MGSATLTLRQVSLKNSINDHQLQNMKLSKKIQRLASFSSHVASGINLNPMTLASLGLDDATYIENGWNSDCSVYNNALDTMLSASAFAETAAATKIASYSDAYSQLKSDKYYSSGLGTEAAIYEDENGNLVTQYAEEKFYKEALKEYIDQVIMPQINELQKDYEEEQAELETLLQQEEAELQSVEQAKQEAIQRETIKL